MLTALGEALSFWFRPMGPFLQVLQPAKTTLECDGVPMTGVDEDADAAAAAAPGDPEAGDTLPFIMTTDRCSGLQADDDEDDDGMTIDGDDRHS